MDWILDNIQIVVLIGIAFASWLKHRFDQQKAEREDHRTGGGMEDEESDFGPEADWEPPQSAPAPSVPPPLVWAAPPRQATPPPMQAMADGTDALLKRQQDMQDRLRQIKEGKANITGGASATRARVAASQSKSKPLQAAKTSLSHDLRNPKSLRKAIIMREILDPPLGLR